MDDLTRTESESPRDHNATSGAAGARPRQRELHPPAPTLALAPMARARNHHGAERIVRPEVARVGADMNVTPLIDILLVLLVIFMAALPATQKGLDVTLPPVADDDPSRRVDSAIDEVVVIVDADRRVAVNMRDVSPDELQNYLREVFDRRRDKTLYIIGAGTLRYRDIVHVIDAARGAGVRQVGIVTDRMRQSRG